MQFYSMRGNLSRLGLQANKKAFLFLLTFSVVPALNQVAFSFRE
ncbi:hypothetical protein IAD21_04287 [Abditibacteriota bacterium]|nr:hypothetical protein IAD21_04287 [Abditibacteriota bacterium]